MHPAAAAATVATPARSAHVDVFDLFLLLVYIITRTFACACLAHHSSCTRGLFKQSSTRAQADCSAHSSKLMFAINKQIASSTYLLVWWAVTTANPSAQGLNYQLTTTRLIQKLSVRRGILKVRFNLSVRRGILKVRFNLSVWRAVDVHCGAPAAVLTPDLVWSRCHSMHMHVHADIVTCCAPHTIRLYTRLQWPSMTLQTYMHTR
jgi:hypothetical protein